MRSSKLVFGLKLRAVRLTDDGKPNQFVSYGKTDFDFAYFLQRFDKIDFSIDISFFGASISRLRLELQSYATHYRC